MSRRDTTRHANRPTRRTRRDRGRSSSNGRSASGSNGSANGWVRHGTALPGWTDLEPSRNRRRPTSDESFLERVSTVRFALLVLVVAGAFTLYVGHVHATTDLLNQLQETRAENRRLHLKYNRVKGEFDQRTGPSIIYERAREMGLQATVSYGQPISLDEE